MQHSISHALELYKKRCIMLLVNFVFQNKSHIYPIEIRLWYSELSDHKLFNICLYLENLNKIVFEKSITTLVFQAFVIILGVETMQEQRTLDLL